MPFNIKSGTYADFDKFVNDMFDIAGPNGYHQDSILIKYPDKNPQYYSCWTQKPEEGIMFTGTSLNDITKEYFTALKKWSDISKKSNFDIQGSTPQRFSFVDNEEKVLECYMNDFPKSNAEHYIRTKFGELVRFENYPSK